MQLVHFWHFVHVLVPTCNQVLSVHVMLHIIIVMPGTYIACNSSGFMAAEFSWAISHVRMINNTSLEDSDLDEINTLIYSCIHIDALNYWATN